jgi:transcriptional regulator with XRE-family HTH domain
VSTAEQQLAQRIKELRRRHFGAQGKGRFAQRLGVPVDEYSRYERGTVPAGDVLVRICEITGEDLQWLLTGVAGRGTVVIAGTRGRHRDLLARLARLLDEQPQMAAPLEAFVDLLARSALPREAAAALPGPDVEHLIPIFEPDELPMTLATDEGGKAGPFDLAPLRADLEPTAREAIAVAEPAMQYPAEALRATELLTVAADGKSRQYLRSAEIARCFPGVFGVRLRDEGDRVQLGRVTDGECEQVPRDKVLWSLEVLYRLARAA